MNKKGLQSFEEKTLVVKINCYFSDQSKKTESSNNDTNCFEKNTELLMNYKDMSSANKGAGTYNSKKGVLYEWKKDLEEPLRRKTYLRKTCSLFR